MNPRKYQAEAIQFCMDALTAHQRAVIQLPTGSGKSLVLLTVAQKWRAAKKPVYIIAPTVEAVTQLRALAARLGLIAEVDVAQRKASPRAQLTITTYNSAWHRYRQRITGNTLCILDECHHVNFAATVNQSILESFGHAIGLSATPWSKGCIDYFSKNKFVYGLSNAIADGVNSEFDICNWNEPTKGNYQIVYTKDSTSRVSYCASLPNADYAIWKRRDARKIIARFRHGLVGTIIVNQMLTEGFDQPQIKKVWIARKTRSRIAVMQMAGRALRPFSNQRARIVVADDAIRQVLEIAIRKAG